MTLEDDVERFIKRIDSHKITYTPEEDIFDYHTDSSFGEMGKSEVAEYIEILRSKIVSERVNRKKVGNTTFPNYWKIIQLLRFAMFIHEMEFEYSYTIMSVLKLVTSEIRKLTANNIIAKANSSIENGKSIIRLELDATGFGNTILSEVSLDYEKDGLLAILNAKYEIEHINQENENPPSNIRKPISGRVRQNVLMRDNYTCQICGATVKDGAKLEIDHIIPFSKGGTNHENNLQVLCRQCNREKHNRDDLLHDQLKLQELKGEAK